MGRAGGATFDMTAGTIDVADNFILGNGSDPTTASQSGGTIEADEVFLAGQQTATYTLSGGSITTVGDFNVGNQASANGTLEVSGSGVINAGSQFRVGISGQGTVNQTGGTVEAETNLIVGGGAAAQGNYTLGGSGVANVQADLIIGNNAGASNLGEFTLEADGDLNVTGNALVGNSGNGELTVTGGTLDAANVIVANESDSTGTLTVSGGTLNTGIVSVGGAFNNLNQSVSNNAGTFAVEGGLADINVTSSFFADGDDPTLAFTIDETGISLIDVVNNALIAAATVDMAADPGASLLPGDTFDLLTASTIDGLPTLATGDEAAWTLQLVGGGRGQVLQATFVPEPATAALLAAGVLGMCRRTARRHNA